MFSRLGLEHGLVLREEKKSLPDDHLDLTQPAEQKDLDLLHQVEQATFLEELEEIWLEGQKKYQFDTEARMMDLVIQHEELILASIRDAKFKQKLKELLINMFRNHVAQIAARPQIIFVFNIFPDLGTNVLQDALDAAKKYLDKSIFGSYAGYDLYHYCDFIRNTIQQCERINLPWIKIKDTIFLETRDELDTYYLSQARPFKETIDACLKKRAEQWKAFPAVYAELRTEITQFPRQELTEALQNCKPVAIKQPHSPNPLIHLWNILLGKLAADKLSGAAIELLTLFSELTRAFENEDMTRVVNIALAGIKICGNSSNLPVFFGGKNRASLFAALLGISYQSCDDKKFIPDFCRVQFTALERLPALYQEFREHIQASNQNTYVFEIARGYVPLPGDGKEIEMQSAPLRIQLQHSSEEKEVKRRTTR